MERAILYYYFVRKKKDNNIDIEIFICRGSSRHDNYFKGFARLKNAAIEIYSLSWNSIFQEFSYFSRT